MDEEYSLASGGWRLEAMLSGAAQAPRLLLELAPTHRFAEPKPKKHLAAEGQQRFLPPASGLQTPVSSLNTSSRPSRLKHRCAAFPAPSS